MESNEILLKKIAMLEKAVNDIYDLIKNVPDSKTEIIHDNWEIVENLTKDIKNKLNELQ